MHTDNSRGGFTMVELMVVITILGLLAGIVAVNSLALTDRAAIQVTKTQVVHLDQAVKTFHTQNRRLPDSMEELIARDSGSGLDTEDPPLDAWDRELLYEKNGSREYTILSLGADGIEGGEGIDADIDVPAARRREKHEPK